MSQVPETRDNSEDLATSSSALLAPARLVRAWAIAGNLDGLPACSELADLASGHPELPEEQRIPPSPEALGGVYQRSLAIAERQESGVWYTPRKLAEGLARQALACLFEKQSSRPTTVLDPACGGGAFLLASARAQHASGQPGMDIFAGLQGWDIDPRALLVARASLELLAVELGVPGSAVNDVALNQADFLVDGAATQLSFDAPVLDIPRVGLVLGNPPFLSQLRKRTSRAATDRGKLQQAMGKSARGYVDGAALFLERAVDVLDENGVVGLILPTSVLGARDAAEVRKQVGRSATIIRFWRDGAEPAFPGHATVCAVIARRTNSPRGNFITRSQGLEFEDLPDAELESTDYERGRWGRLLLDQRTLPETPATHNHEVLGSIAEVTADFRDQYYALARLVKEARDVDQEDMAPVVVSGLVDPANLLWGERSARFNKSKWDQPAVSRKALSSDTELADWASSRLRPKVLVATQTQVLEGLVDDDGLLVPSTPLLSVFADPDALWQVCALINSPIATVWALERSAGTALSLDAIKLSASQLRELPLPPDESHWDNAARYCREAHSVGDDGDREASLTASAREVCLAFEMSPESAEAAAEWWKARLPRKSRD